MDLKELSQQDIAQLAQHLNRLEDYRVIQKYVNPICYTQGDDADKKIAAFLDIEATGIGEDDEIIELGIVKFEYNQEGKIFKLLDEFHAYRQPVKKDISKFITNLTGIDQEMVKGKKINIQELAQFLEDVNLIIAHYAQFDRVIFDRTFPELQNKAWACSVDDIDWAQENIFSKKLEYIAYKMGFFFEGHRAISDCLAGIHVLSQILPVSGVTALQVLLKRCNQLYYRLWTQNTPYNVKDLLKQRNYRWGKNKAQNFMSWHIAIPEDRLHEELQYLKNNIYKSTMPIQIDIFDQYNRFTNNPYNQFDPGKYSEELSAAQRLIQQI